MAREDEDHDLELELEQRAEIMWDATKLDIAASLWMAAALTRIAGVLERLEEDGLIVRARTLEETR